MDPDNRNYAETKSSEDDDDDYYESEQTKKNSTNNDKHNNLTQLERDVIAKTQARGSGVDNGIPRGPGATSVPNTGDSSAELSSFERDILSKRQAATAVRGEVAGFAAKRGDTSNTSDLSQIERDIIAKQNARGGSSVAATRPGAVSSNTADASKSSDTSNLTQLERDLLSKQVARASGGSTPTTRPGVISSSSGQQQQPQLGNNNLTQLEQDIMAKQNARGGGSAQAPPTSSLSLPIAGNNNSNNLSQLERDVLSKQNARGGDSREAVGYGDGPISTNNLSQLQRDVISKRSIASQSPATLPGVMRVSDTASVSSQNTSSNLSTLERDVLAKQGAARGTITNTPGSGARAGTPIGDSGSLSQLERDVLSKQAARGMSTSSPATIPGVTVAAASLNADRPGAVGDSGNLTQLERDVLSKQAARGMPTVIPGAVSDTGGLTQLERDVLVKQAARSTMSASPATVPGVTGASSSASANLSNLERDVIAKQSARIGTGNAASQPGVLSSSNHDRSINSASDHLSSLERDVIAKQSARGSGASIPPRVPGVVPASNNNTASGAEAELTQLERDVMLKASIAAAHRSGGGNSSINGVGSDHGSNSAASNLSRLEQDVASKLRASGGTDQPRAAQPGVVRTSGHGSTESDSASVTLNQLESDVAAKARAAAGRSSGPGAVATAALSQLERDIESKASLRGSSHHNNSYHGIATGLSQMEQDIAAKGRSGPNNASQPGIVASSNLRQFEQDIAMKGGSMTMQQQSASGPSTVLNQMENDIRLKNEARGTSGRPVGPGVVPEGGSAVLDQFERDVAMKNSLRNNAEPAMVPGVARAAANQFEEEIVSKHREEYGYINNNNASLGYSQHQQQPPPYDDGYGARAALTQLELDTAAKLNALHGNSNPHLNPAGTLSSLEQFEANMVRDNRVIGSSHGYNNMGGNYGMYDNSMQYPNNNMNMYGQPSVPPFQDYGGYYNNNDDIAMGRSAVPPPYVHEPQYQPEYVTDFVETSSNRPPPPQMSTTDDPVQDAPVTASVAVADPEAPMYPASTLDGEAEATGIEAFFAENVVDATGVAIIMSDEEEALLEKKRQRRLICIGLCCVVVILLAVIVPLSFRSGGPPTPPKAVPTMAPTVAPTLAPTSESIPKAVVALQKYSTLSNLQTRQSPQFLSMDWLTNNDTYVKEKGLTFTSPKWIQRYIMGVFYFHFQGDNWITCNRNDDVCASGNELNSWLSDADECVWWLLGCEDGVLTKMNFGTLWVTIILRRHGAGLMICILIILVTFYVYLAVQNAPDAYHKKSTILNGPFPDEIQFLTGLKQFVLPGFGMRGDVLPLLSTMSNLTIVDLSDNNFTGIIPTTFADEHPLLQSVELSSNTFDGPLPSSLGSLVALTSLNLNENLFQGTIPIEFNGLQKLSKC
jgi:Leucine rich repeat